MTRNFRAFRKLSLLAVLALLAAVPAWPAGFGFFEQGAKATAMGGAFAGQADDPSALFYNPSGIGFQDHYAVMAGATLASITKGDFKGADPIPGAGVTEKEHKTSFLLSHLYIVAPLTSNLKFGLGVFTPYGLAVRWENPETFSGRHISQNADIKTLSFEPVLAYRATPSFSIAAGAEYRISKVTLEQNTAQIDPNTLSEVDVAHVKLTSDNDHAWGWNASFLWKPAPSFSLGASYRSKMTIDYQGHAKFTQRLTGDPVFDALVAAQLPQNPRANTSVAFPAIADFGAAYHAVPADLTVSADAVWTEWSRFSSLDITFPNGEAPNVHRDTGWSNSWSYRVGVEKKFGPVAARVGFVYDQTPQPDRDVSPILPDSNRRGYCVGVGYNTDKFGVDLADMYLPFSDRNTHGKSQDDYNGTYHRTANLFGLDIRLSF
jgi:long-chain fatty acid transport protein